MRINIYRSKKIITWFLKIRIDDFISKCYIISYMRYNTPPTAWAVEIVHYLQFCWILSSHSRTSSSFSEWRRKSMFINCSKRYLKNTMPYYGENIIVSKKALNLLPVTVTARGSGLCTIKSIRGRFCQCVIEWNARNI